jgi:hypothetical protein
MTETMKRRVFCLRLEREAHRIYRKLRSPLSQAGWEATDFSQHCVAAFLTRAARPAFDTAPYALAAKRFFPVFAWQRAMEILRRRHWPAKPFSQFFNSRRHKDQDGPAPEGLSVDSRLVATRRCCGGPGQDPFSLLERGMLPEQIRIIIELRHACGHKPREIALATGLAVTRVYTLLREARRTLRLRLGDLMNANR